MKYQNKYKFRAKIRRDLAEPAAAENLFHRERPQAWPTLGRVTGGGAVRTGQGTNLARAK